MRLRSKIISQGEVEMSRGEVEMSLKMCQDEEDEEAEMLILINHFLFASPWPHHFCLTSASSYLPHHYHY